MHRLRFKDFKSLKQFDFCYICGEFLRHKKNNSSSGNAPDDRNDDHVPPKSVFLPQNRNLALTLPAHRKCNESYSITDEQLAELFRVSRLGSGHGKCKTISFEIKPEIGSGSSVTIDINPIVARWARACHAAIYRRPLAHITGFRAVTPMYEVVESSDGTGVSPNLDQDRLFSGLLRANFLSDNFDSIEAWGGSFRYRCVWTKLDPPVCTDVCVFGVQLLDWNRFDSVRPWSPRGCFGFYVPPNGRPHDATSSVRFDSTDVPLIVRDPFSA